MIRERHMLVFMLCGRESNVVLVLGGQLAGGSLSVHTARTTVEAYVIHGNVVDDGLVINVGHVSHVNVADRAVVVEVVAPPVATLKTNTGVSESVVDSTVEADVRTPVTGMP